MISFCPISKTFQSFYRSSKKKYDYILVITQPYVLEIPFQKSFSFIMYFILLANWPLSFFKDRWKWVIYPIYYTKKYKIKHTDIPLCSIDKKINTIDILHLNISFIYFSSISFASISAIKEQSGSI